MDFTYIESQWVNRMNADIASSISAWDSVAEDYVYDDTVRLDNNLFLLYLQEKVPLTKDMTVLDVGCGAGAYSIALAEKIQKAVGVDYSPKMITAAERTATQLGTMNTEFFVRDWYDCSDHSFDGKFHLVFVHTTPAIADYGTFVKMMRQWHLPLILCGAMALIRRFLIRIQYGNPRRLLQTQKRGIWED